MKRIISVLLSLSLMLAILPVTIASAGGRMDGWGVSRATEVTTENGIVGLDEDEKYEGTHSLKISYSLPVKANRYMMLWNNLYGLKVGKTYKYGLAVKAVNAKSGQIWIDYSNRKTLTPFGENADWNTYTFTWTATKTDIQLQIGIDNITEGLWIDDVWFCEVLEDGSLGPNIIACGTFDDGAPAANNAGNNNSAPAQNDEISSLESLYNEIITADTFSAEDMRKVVGGFSYAPVYKAEGITIDGDLSDWEGYPEIGLPTKRTQILENNPTHPLDSKAWCKYAYDEEYFYLGIKVQDEVIKVNTSTGNYWRADSVQIALCNVGKTYEEEIGFAYNPNGSPTMGSTSYGESQLKTMPTEIKLTDDGIIYEFAFPWNLKYEDGKLPEGFLFDIIINDNDYDETKNREYVLELAPGISQTKNSAEFPYLEFCDSKADWYGWVEGPEELRTGDSATYSYYLVNEGEEKTVTIDIPLLGVNESVVIPKGQGIRKSYTTKCEERGKFTLDIIATDGTKEHKSSMDFKVKAQATDFEKMVTTIQGWTDEIKTLLDECENKGITTDYELVNYTVMYRYAYPYSTSDGRTWTGYLKRDIDAGNDERVEFNYERLEEIYNDTQVKLQAYLDGTEEPLPAVRFVQSPIRIDNKTVYTTTETNGVREERPFYFTGFGHFWQVWEDIDLMQDFGYNIVQMALEPISYITYSGSDDEPFLCQPNGKTEAIHKYLQSAEENNVKVDFLLGIHNIPDWIRTKWTDYEGSAKVGVVVEHKQNLLHPMYKKLVDAHVKFVMEQYGGYECISTICLTNEPTTNTNSSFNQPYWALYLVDLYDNDINKLNETYGTNYEKFIDVPMYTTIDYSIRFNDWKDFNEQILWQSNEYIAEQVKKYDPDMPVHSKMMSYTKSADYNPTHPMTYGTQHEHFAPFCEINGNDVASYVHSTHTSLAEMEFFQDIQTGIKDAPCFNSEDHMIVDWNTELTEYNADHCYTKLWQSFMHANSFSTIWQWDYITDPNQHSYGLPPSDPSVLVKTGQVGFDANRLAYEISTIVEEEPEIAVLYSYKSRAWSQYAVNGVYRVWWAGLQNGAKTELVPENWVERIHDYKVLVIPNATHVSEKTVEEIKKFAESGKKILFLGDNTIAKNWRNEPHNEADIEYIKSNSQFINTEGSGAYITSHNNSQYVAMMRDLLEEMDMRDIVVIDQDTGKPIEDIEFMYADYTGKTIINFMSMDESKVRKFKIYKNGVEQTNLFELISDKQLPSSVVELDVYSPMLIRLDNPSEAPVVKAPELNVVIDGEQYNFTEAKPFVDENNRTLVPIRFVSEALEAKVDWDGETKTVTITKGEDVITYTVGAFEGYKNGEKVEFDTCGIIKDSRTFVPVRFIATLLDCEVLWEQETKTVIINSGKSNEAEMSEASEQPVDSEEKTDSEEVTEAE